MQIAPSNRRLSAYGATLAVVLLASSAPAVTRLSLKHDLGPLDLVLLRCGIGGLVFLPFLLINWRQLAPDRLQATGLALIAMGALTLRGHSSWSSFDSNMWIGDVLFLLSSALAAAYLVYVQQHAVDPTQATALVAIYSGIVGGLLLAAWPASSALWTAPTTAVLAQAIFQGLGMGACAVLLASYATRQLGSQRFAVFFTAVPVLSLFFGRAIVDDGIHAHEALAVALVSSGIFVAGVLTSRSAGYPVPHPRNNRIQS